MRITIGKSGSENAYSLVEVVVASGVAGIMFAALLGGLSSGFNSVQLDRENSRASQILLEKTELLRLYNWNQITGADTNVYLPTTFTAPFYPDTNNGGFTYAGTVTVTNATMSASYTNDMRSVTIALRWTSNKIAHYRSMTTLVSRYGLQNYIY
jgi:type II secretory pathway pseudopilin PulG